jgi:type I restriction enzyme S subunit
LTEWREVCLGDYAKVLGGYAFKSTDFLPYGDYPVIKIKNIAKGYLDMSECQYISSSIAAQASRFKAEYGDILIAMTGSHITQPSSMVGRVAKYNIHVESYINQRVGKVISIDKSLLDTNFLYYFMTCEDTTYSLANIASGSANQANISSEQIESLELLLPDIDEQKAIAEVLSSLDDKIDLLTRQNNTLEDLGQAFFRKWFVEDADEKLKKYPLSELMVIQNGFAFRSRDYQDAGKYKIVTIKNVQDGFIDTSGTTFLNQLPVGMPDYVLLTIGDVLISLTGNVGRVGIVVEDNLLLNQRVAKISPYNPEYLPFLYFYFRNETTREYLINLAHGTAQANLSPIETLKTEVSFSKTLIKKYSELFMPMYQKIIKNKQQIIVLQKLRDTLLPKLISGEVRVKL